MTKISLILIFILSGCSMMSGGAGDGTFDEDGETSLTTDENRFGEGSIPLAQAGKSEGAFSDIYFDYDSSLLDSEGRQKLVTTAEILKSDRSLQVEIEGHCDERGTSEYNLALGENRARKVAEELVKLGIEPSRLSTISYGEELPVDPRSEESAYSKNRRAHFAVYRNKTQ